MHPLPPPPLFGDVVLETQGRQGFYTPHPLPSAKELRVLAFRRGRGLRTLSGWARTDAQGGGPQGPSLSAGRSVGSPLPPVVLAGTEGFRDNPLCPARSLLRSDPQGDPHNPRSPADRPTGSSFLPTPAPGAPTSGRSRSYLPFRNVNLCGHLSHCVRKVSNRVIHRQHYWHGSYHLWKVISHPSHLLWSWVGLYLWYFRY